MSMMDTKDTRIMDSLKTSTLATGEMKRGKRATPKGMRFGGKKPRMGFSPMMIFGMGNEIL
jgi:hypothetical protein|tara:strand:- start:333 stop:515 length:183 start_codon:yes stop_codon:yes gene_type:complete